jgi:hypothetical protein
MEQIMYNDDNNKKEDIAEKLAIIEARKEAFSRSPLWFTVWDITKAIINVVLWLGMFFILAQCSCDGCILGGN